MNEIERYAKEDASKAVILNKTDLPESERKVTSEDRDGLREFGEKENCKFYETSAKDASVRVTVALAPLYLRCIFAIRIVTFTGR